MSFSRWYKGFMGSIVIVLLGSALAAAQAPPEGPPDGPPEVGPPPTVSQAPPQGPGGPTDGPPPFGPPPNGQRPGSGGPAARGRVTPAMESRFLAFVKENDPSALEGLTKLKSQNPGQYQRVVSEGVERMRFLEMVKRNDPAGYQSLIQEFKLESSTRRLAESYKQASADRKPAIKEQLRQALSQLFDVREVNRKSQIQRLEKELARMKTTMQKRARNRSTIVNRRLDDMLSDPSTTW